MVERFSSSALRILGFHRRLYSHGNIGSCAVRSATRGGHSSSHILSSARPKLISSASCLDRFSPNRTERRRRSPTRWFSSDSTTTPLKDRYEALVREENVKPDPHQLDSLAVLEKLRSELLQSQPCETFPTTTIESNNADSDDQSWFSSSSSSSWMSTSRKGSSALGAVFHEPSPRGVYLHGGVGCGKTFLMNLFYQSLRGTDWGSNRQKIHFHSFMLQVHQGMHRARQERTHDADDVMHAVAAQTLQRGRLLCLDEFQVTDIADAMILQRLFQTLWDHGCVVVATSNRPPDMLYHEGLQRELFVPFIGLLEKQTSVVSMDKSTTDYRELQKLESSQASSATQSLFHGPAGKRELDSQWFQLTAGHRVGPMKLQVPGQRRRIKIPQACSNARLRVARFGFQELCGQALGAADYLTLGEHFDTMVVDDIPRLGIHEINWLRRLITLVDSLYECHCQLWLHTTAAVPMDELVVRKSTDHHDELFAFDRTLSRLQEMGSTQYLNTKWLSRRRKNSSSGAAATPVVDVVPSLGDEKAKKK